MFVQRADPSLWALSLTAGLVVMAAATKRAQIPFSAWLPAAMAAPTPVSALVHSSTLVTAGVYLLIRMSHWLGEGGWLGLVLLGGSLTITMAGVSALFEPDIKKIVALSTLSQLGLIIRAVGAGLWGAAFIHLLAHAYFKALLFIAVGNIIHLSDDFQDMRKGALSPGSSVTYGFRALANLRLCGLPFLSGFFSKDFILERSATANSPSLGLMALYLGVALTAAYSTRFMLACWWASTRKSPIT